MKLQPKCKLSHYLLDHQHQLLFQHQQRQHQQHQILRELRRLCPRFGIQTGETEFGFSSQFNSSDVLNSKNSAPFLYHAALDIAPLPPLPHYLPLLHPLLPHPPSLFRESELRVMLCVRADLGMKVRA